MVNTEIERLYLDTNDFVKNENGRYVYANRNGEHIVDMECILEDYYEWRKSRELPYKEEIWMPAPIEDAKKKWWQFWKINIKPVL
jgi:hypothetical protein